MNRLLTNVPSCPEYFADVQHGDLLLAMNEKMNRLTETEVGVDDGSFLPGEDADWVATTFDP